MASLKEIKADISSTRSILNVTSVMRMIASTKLTVAQRQAEGMQSYSQAMEGIAAKLVSMAQNSGGTGGKAIDLPQADVREVKRVAIVAVASDTAFCGVYNSNVAKALHAVLETYKHLPKSDIMLVPIGKKIASYVQGRGYVILNDFAGAVAKPSYQEAARLADRLNGLFLSKQVDQVELIYHRFKNIVMQTLVRETFLPMSATQENGQAPVGVDEYILEPEIGELLPEIIPKVLRTKAYDLLINASASEHAARSVAMETAAGNAEEHIRKMKIRYNKERQRMITDELMDIAGGMNR